MNFNSSRPGVCVLASAILFVGGLACSKAPVQEATAPTAEEPAEAAAPAPPAYEMPPIVAGTAPKNSYSAEQIARGKLLVSFSGCNDCHTPWSFNPEFGMPMPDMSRMLSGHPKGAPLPQGKLGPGDMALIGPSFTAFGMPFGIVYAANLTPDIETGSGSWTEEMFLNIFRKGRHLGGDGRGVLPPMPWPMVRTLPEKDLVAIFAYLRSVPPIHNLVPSPDVPEEVIWGMRDNFDKLLAMMDAH